MKNLAITLTLICALMIGAQSSAQVTLEDASAVWLFEENAGNTVGDSSGNGNNGTLNAANWAEGRFGTGLALGEASSVMSSTANGVGRTFLSECLWIKFSDFSTENQFGYIRGSGTPSERYFYFSTWCAAGPPHDCIHLGTIDTAGGWGRGIVTNPLFEADRWYFVCGVINNETGNISAYVDGVQQHSQDFTAGDPPGTPVEIWVGGTPEAYQWVQGTIDEVAFFNVALTEADINRIMTEGLAPDVTAVNPQGKLATTWGSLKGR